MSAKLLADKRTPYPGMRPFGRDESDLFFGREEAVARLLTQLSANRFAVIIGPSGCGKSSLVSAGLIPALEGGFLSNVGSRWRIVIARPAHHPIEALARFLSEALAVDSSSPVTSNWQFTYATLRRGPLGLIEVFREAGTSDHTNFLLIIDQFEELFGVTFLNPDRDEPAEFAGLLTNAVSQSSIPIYIVLTLRSDFVGDCSTLPYFPELMTQGLFLLPALNREQRADAIVGPARLFGVEIEPVLVTRLLNETSAEREGLALLQHILRRMWDLASREVGDALRVLDLQHYEMAGGVHAGLEMHVEEIFNSLSSAQQLVARTLFGNLVRMSNDGRPFRSGLPFSEAVALCGVTGEQLAEVVEMFRGQGNAMLSPPPSVPLTLETFIDIKNEAVIRRWQRLQAWLKQARDSVETFRRLRETANLWSEGKAGLLRDVELVTASDWIAKARPSEAWARQHGGGLDSALEFLQLSQEAHAREVQMEKRRILVFRSLVTILLALLLLFVIGMSYVVLYNP